MTVEIKDTFPNLKEFQKAVAEGYNVIPVVREIPGDLETPVSTFLKIRQGDYNFLLESVEGGESIARYSFIGTKPIDVLTQNRTDPLLRVEEHLSKVKYYSLPSLPEMFSGGYVGYIAYDCVQYYEPTVKIPLFDDLQLPESVLMLCSSLIVFDHVQHVIRVVSHCHTDATSDCTAMYSNALKDIDSVISQLKSPIPQSNWTPPVSKPVSQSPLDSQETFQSHVSVLKNHITKGDIIQAVPSRRNVLACTVDPFEVYRQLRVVNPSPYMFYFDLGSFQVSGASPELLVRVRNGHVTTHPIAGTRRRGLTTEEDSELALDLLKDPKERAEHTMLVDLGRNDLGRICNPGSVSVPSLMQIERYSHVMHIVSQVEGTLSPSKTPFDAFRSVFPAGTVSGAPKVKAMQLVAQLEQRRRGVYAGAIGYFGFNKTLDSCIAIRTIVFKDGIAICQAGGGIVSDSDAVTEYEETESKMRALVNAIERTGSRKRVHEESASYKLQCIGNTVQSLPQSFGEFGGRYVPETLVSALDTLEQLYLDALKDPSFHTELRHLHKQYTGRPTPLYLASRLTSLSKGARIWFKREDLCHTGAHKINNALGQALLAKRSGKHRIIAETGAGQHGVASATACALLGLDCTVYMGEEDVRRQALNVFRMKLLGATVKVVKSGARTLKDAINEAMRDWVTNVRTTFYLLGSAVGPHPFPTIVRDFQRIIGDETKEQMQIQMGKLPDVLVACVGGGSNAIGMFHPFIDDVTVKMVGCEAAGCGLGTQKHSATIVGGTPGVLHGSRTFLLQDTCGQITETHSISAGLDYPGVGPQHAHLFQSRRAQYVGVTDVEAMEGVKLCSQLEGIIPALETAHAVYYAVQLAKQMKEDEDIVVCLSGRGDKDMERVAEEMGFSVN